MKKQAKNAKKPVTNVKRPSKGTVNNKGACKGGSCRPPAKKRGAK